MIDGGVVYVLAFSEYDEPACRYHREIRCWIGKEGDRSDNTQNVRSVVVSLTDGRPDLGLE